MRSFPQPGLIRIASWCLVLLGSASFQRARNLTGDSDAEDLVSAKVVRKIVRDASSRRPATRLEAWRQLAEMRPELSIWHAELKDDGARAAQDDFVAILGGSLVDGLVALRGRRAQLDRARASALELIRDTERYFYPSNAPDVTVERARLFPAVRREVERRVEAVRLLWEHDEGVDVSEDERTAIRELISIERVAQGIGFDVNWPPELPRWILGVADVSGRIDLRNFVWTDEDAQRRRYDRAVTGYNESRWQAAQPSDQALDADYSPSAARQIECEQVRLTNAYRRMLGERALAWSEALQRAAYGHSKYMASRAVLTHAERLSGHETPFARMQSEGYRYGRAENIYFGPGGALAAHLRWVGSSGHHRALLNPQARGMASVEVNGYWTQNLGTSTSFTGTPEFKKALWHD